jgi:hypothetical protein
MSLVLAVLHGCDAVQSAEASYFPGTPPPTATACVEPTPIEAGASIVGVWNVVWDRSATGWTPPRFHGSLVVNADGTVGVDWHEGTGDPSLRRLEVDGERFLMEWSWPTRPGALTVLDGRVEGEELIAQMKSTDSDGRGVPWSPLHGRRVPILEMARATSESP